jgi:hypothetical protein
MPDFTLHTFRRLLLAFKDQQYLFQTFASFLKNPASRAIILRHDVDARKLNSLRTAQIEADLGITGTYNFRIVPKSFDEDIIRRIAAMGHEIGYHYEDLSTTKGDYEKAIRLFEQNLTKLRHLVPIETICMHGSPLSKYDNRKIWENYDYRNYGIIGEPYFDLDFNNVLYLTDTGRRWDGVKVSVRDKAQYVIREPVEVERKIHNSLPLQPTTCNFHTTFDIIRSTTHLSDHIMINVHPQRWDDRPLLWIREFFLQNLKNVVKRMIAG